MCSVVARAPLPLFQIVVTGPALARMQRLVTEILNWHLGDASCGAMQQDMIGDDDVEEREDKISISEERNRSDTFCENRRTIACGAR
jgi:hypothetical protein